MGMVSQCNGEETRAGGYGWRYQAITRFDGKPGEAPVNERYGDVATGSPRPILCYGRARLFLVSSCCKPAIEFLAHGFHMVTHMSVRLSILETGRLVVP